MKREEENEEGEKGQGVEGTVSKEKGRGCHKGEWMAGGVKKRKGWDGGGAKGVPRHGRMEGR